MSTTATVIDFASARLDREYRRQLDIIKARRARFNEYAADLDDQRMRDFLRRVAAEDPREMAMAVAREVLAAQ